MPSRRVVFAIDMKSEDEVLNNTIELIREPSELAVYIAVDAQVEKSEPITE